MAGMTCGAPRFIFTARCRSFTVMRTMPENARLALRHERVARGDFLGAQVSLVFFFILNSPFRATRDGAAADHPRELRCVSLTHYELARRPNRTRGSVDFSFSIGAPDFAPLEAACAGADEAERRARGDRGSDGGDVWSSGGPASCRGTRGSSPRTDGQAPGEGAGVSEDGRGVVKETCVVSADTLGRSGGGDVGARSAALGPSLGERLSELTSPVERRRRTRPTARSSSGSAADQQRGASLSGIRTDPQTRRSLRRPACCTRSSTSSDPWSTD